MSYGAEILWFTGLSGSGKTTIAIELEEILQKRGYPCLILDGDIIRAEHDVKLGYSEEDIRTNNIFIANLAIKYLDDYDYIIVPIISPFKKHRSIVRSMLPSKFHEIYIRCSLECCMKRDVKGLYQKAIDGEILNMIGLSLSSPYEPPLDPDLTIDTDQLNLHDSINIILKYLKLDP